MAETAAVPIMKVLATVHYLVLATAACIVAICST